MKPLRILFLLAIVLAVAFASCHISQVRHMQKRADVPLCIPTPKHPECPLVRNEFKPLGS